MIGSLNSAVVLTPADVRVIRRYVHAKYASLPGGKRAEIVAAAVRQTVNRRLPDLPADVKERIAGKLIRQCLVNEHRAIEPDDVLDVCATVALPDPAMEAVIVDSVLRWVQERAPGQWSGERLAARLYGQRRFTGGSGKASSDAGYPLAIHSHEHGEIVSQAAAATDKPTRFSAAAIPRLAWIAAAIVLAGGVAMAAWWSEEEAALPTVPPAPSVAVESPALQAPSPDVGMPESLRYREVDEAAVKAYLISRDSMLADEPYYSAILDSGRRHDVNPLLLFAITGQEQGFVPKSAKQAKRIANNPFNVYHSWEKFNTEIGQSADIAARTVSRQADKRPEGFDPFEWLNETYAEDPNWAKGVRILFNQLSSLQGAPNR